MNFAAYLAEKTNKPELAALEKPSFAHTLEHLHAEKQLNDTVKKHAAAYLGLPLASPPKDLISDAILGPVTLPLAKKFLFLPIEETKDGRIIAAIGDSTKALPLADDYATATGKPLELKYMEAHDLTALINRTWDAKSQQAAEVAKDVEAQSEDDIASLAAELNEPEDLIDSTNDAPIIRLINSTISQAVKEGASDIHIEPFEKQVFVRFRVDGVMHTVITPSRSLHAAMSARLKVMAGLDIAEKRLPQDGRFTVRVAGKPNDVRISTLPTQHGERVVLRLLGKGESFRALKQTGLRGEQLEVMQGFFNEPNGMVYVCGPTGSGKTSTLYSGLAEINTPDKNIVTVEDPVEYELEGVGQIQVNPKIGLTFAGGLRSILRQDPDVVVVGETRDRETAQIAIEASLTGHLVLSTIHTNDAPSAVTRLLEMGIEPFLVASSMRGVVAQRMVRLLHPATKKPRELDAQTKKLFDALPAAVRPKEITLFEPASTAECPTGYQGRTGIFEILVISDTIRSLINAQANDDKIRKQAQSEGMLTLYQEGLLRAARGETSLEEVMRVTRS